jgi:hypothetical protein
VLTRDRHPVLVRAIDLGRDLLAAIGLLTLVSIVLIAATAVPALAETIGTPASATTTAPDSASTTTITTPASAAPTDAASPTASPTSTATPTATVSPTTTPSPTATASPTGTATPTAIPTATPAVTASPTTTAAPKTTAIQARSAASPGTIALGTAGSYLVLGGGGVTSTGRTIVAGDLGVDAGAAINGFPPGQVGGDTHNGDAAAAQAVKDAKRAYDQAAALPPTTDPDPAGSLVGVQNGRTITPGTYKTVAAYNLAGTVTLDGQGDPTSTFVFQIGGAVTIGAASKVLLTNGAVASHVFWQVDGAVTIGANVAFSGVVLASGAITSGEGARDVGPLLTPDLVTLANNIITRTNAAPPAITLTGAARAFTPGHTPTLSGTLTTSGATDQTVIVTIAGQTLTRVVPGGNGTFSATATTLPDGVYDVVATVTVTETGDRATARQVYIVGRNSDLVDLRTATSYSVFGAGVVNTSTTHLSGDLGSSGLRASISGFATVDGGPGTIGGVITDASPGDSPTYNEQVRLDIRAAYDDARTRIYTDTFAGSLAGVVFTAGVHYTDAAISLAADAVVTLDGQNNPDAVFIFQVNGAITTGAGSRIVLTNGALASHVFWENLGAVTLGATSGFTGTILSNAAITISAGASLSGRALATGAVTLDNSQVTNPPADGALTITLPGTGVTLSSVTDSVDGSVATGQLGQVTVTDTRTSNQDWTASISCTAFTTSAGGPGIAPENIRYTLGPLTSSGVATSTTGSDACPSTPSAALTTTHVKGTNTANWNPTLSVTVPPNTRPGTYTATLTHSVA